MTDRLANSLSAASTGLQTKDAYKRKREEIQQAAALGKSAVVAPPPDGSGAAGEEKAGAAAKKKKKKAASSVLSFGDELEEETISPRLQTKGMGKDTTSNVSFLKPNEREAHEAAQATDARGGALNSKQAQSQLQQHISDKKVVFENMDVKWGMDLDSEHEKCARCCPVL